MEIILYRILMIALCILFFIGAYFVALDIIAKRRKRLGKRKTLFIIDRTNNKVVSIKGIGFQIHDKMEAHDIAEHLAYTYPNTHFDVVSVVELKFSTKGF